MYTVEKKSKKLLYCSCFTIGTLVYLFLGFVHVYRAENANRINNDHLTLEDVSNAYDSCAVTGVKYDPFMRAVDREKIRADYQTYCFNNAEVCFKYGTQWTAAFNINGILLVLMACNFILLIFGSFYFYPRLVGTYLNCCCSCGHIAVAAYALALRFNPVGAHCAINVARIQYKGASKFDDTWTYKRDGDTLAALCILQVIFWCC